MLERATLGREGPEDVGVVVSGHMSAVRAEDSTTKASSVPAEERAPFAAECEQVPHLFAYTPTDDVGWQHLRYPFVREVDATLADGGGNGTYRVGLETMLANKRLAPIAS